LTRPLRGEHFLLVDDVVTTGATLNELARTLKNAGAERVEAWVIDRMVDREYGGGYKLAAPVSLVQVKADQRPARRHWVTRQGHYIVGETYQSVRPLTGS